MFRHCEPFVRLACCSTLKDSGALPCSRPVDRRISTAVNLLLPRGLTAGADMPCQSVEVCPVGRSRASASPYQNPQGTVTPALYRVGTNLNPRRSRSDLHNATSVQQLVPEYEHAVPRHILSRSAASYLQSTQANGSSAKVQVAPESSLLCSTAKLSLHAPSLSWL